MHNLGFESTYCSNVYNLLIQVGQPGLWLTNDLYDYSWFKCYVKNTLGDLYIQQWYNTLREKSVYSNYVTFKNDFLMEPYIKILPISCAIAFFRFRTTNNKEIDDAIHWSKDDDCKRSPLYTNGNFISSFSFFILSRDLGVFGVKLTMINA